MAYVEAKGDSGIHSPARENRKEARESHDDVREALRRLTVVARPKEMVEGHVNGGVDQR
jgi:hypothetical protein